jgi:hypothetical protein
MGRKSLRPLPLPCPPPLSRGSGGRAPLCATTSAPGDRGHTRQHGCAQRACSVAGRRWGGTIRGTRGDISRILPLRSASRKSYGETTGSKPSNSTTTPGRRPAIPCQEDRQVSFRGTTIVLAGGRARRYFSISTTTAPAAGGDRTL